MLIFHTYAYSWKLEISTVYGIFVFLFIMFFSKNKKTNPFTMPIHHIQYQSQSIKHQKRVKWITFYGWKMNKIFFYEFFSFCFHFIGSHVVVLVVHISVSNKSYGLFVATLMDSSRPLILNFSWTLNPDLNYYKIKFF